MFDPRSHPDGHGETVDESAWVTRLVMFATPDRRDKWSENKGVEDWANESLQLAKQAYTDPATGKMIQNGQRLGADYERWAIDKVEERLAQSGVRLADILNDVFGDH